MLAQQALQHLEDVFVDYFALLPATDLDRSMAGFDQHVGTRAQKRVAPDLLAALRPIPAGTRAVRPAAIARKAETGVSRSALTDFTTGTSVDSRARRENSLKSGCSMVWTARVSLDPQSRGLFIIGDG